MRETACAALSTTAMARGYRMRVGPMTPIVPVPAPSSYVEATRLSDRKLGSGMLGADDDRQPGSVDALVQQPHEPPFLFDHQQQRLKRGDRQALILADQRRRAIHVQRAFLGQSP